MNRGLHINFRNYLAAFGGSILCLAFICCNSPKRELQKTVEAWQGKTIRFPDTLETKIYGADTLCPDLLGRRFKIINYVDTSGCSDCRLHLYDWQMMKEETDSMNIDVAIVFIAWVNDYENLESLVRINRFGSPVIYDRKGVINRMNHFPAHPLFQTFLLDRENQVILIGNPIGNPKLWTLYKEKMLEGSAGEKTALTEKDSIQQTAPARETPEA